MSHIICKEIKRIEELKGIRSIYPFFVLQIFLFPIKLILPFNNEEFCLTCVQQSGHIDEKWLVALYPAEALLVKAAQSRTDKITSERYPNWIDGDKGNAFRHALWDGLTQME